MKKSLVLSSCALALLAMCSAVRAEETIFQNGMNDYKGAQDTTLRADFDAQKTANLWGENQLFVSGVSIGGWKMMTLIRFNDFVGTANNQIPKNAKITDVKLELFKLTNQPKDEGQYDKAEPNDVIAAHRMKTHCFPGDASDKANIKASCFSYRLNDPELPQFWGEKNQLESGPVRGVDYEAEQTAEAKIQPKLKNDWLVWDVTSVVRDWVAGDAPNEGLFLTTRGWWIGANFSSSEAADTTHRPRLIVEWDTPCREYSRHSQSADIQK